MDAGYWTTEHMPLKERLDKVRQSDLVVIAGTPIIYMVSGHSFLSDPWASEVFKKRLKNISDKPLISLGIGSILEDDEQRLTDGWPDEMAFLKEFVDRNNLITTRDRITQDLLVSLAPERKGKVIESVCPSLWASESLGIARNEKSLDGNLIGLSFSVESSNWDSKPHRSADARRHSADLIVGHLLKRHRDVRLICHNEIDYDVQKEIAAAHGLQKPLVASARSMLECLSGARAAITWRIHGAIGALSLGVPALLFKTDSRWETAERLGATTWKDDSQDVGTLLQLIDDFIMAAPDRSVALSNFVREKRQREEAKIVEAIRRANPIAP